MKLIKTFCLFILFISFYPVHAQNEVESKNLKLHQFKVSKCDSKNPGVDIKKRIISLENKNGLITIKVAGSANCCAKIAGQIQLKSTNYVNLLFKDDEEACNCICAREFTYVFESGKYAGFELNGYEIVESDEEVVSKRVERTYYPSGNKHTVKFFEDNVLKRIIYYSESGEYIKTQYYKDGVLESEHTK